MAFNDGDLSTLSKLKFGSTSYALKDAAARTNITALESAVDLLNGVVSSEGSVLYMINHNAANASYDTTNTIAEKIAAIDSAVALLNGSATDTGSVLNSIISSAGSGTFTFTGAETATTIAAAIQANADAIAAAGKGMFKVVSADSDIPVDASGLGVIYLVPDANEGYKEWVVINTGTEAEPVYAKEEIGDTHIDLTSYATQAWVSANAVNATYDTGVTIGDAIAANASAIGAWTDTTRSDTVKAAIETLESQVTGTTVKSVNGIAADSTNEGAITVRGDDIARSSADTSTTLDAALTALESDISRIDSTIGANYSSTASISSDIGTWTTTGTFVSSTVKAAIESNESAINAIKANSASALTSLSGGTWEIDSTDSEMMVWTAISTSDATFLSAETI